MEPSTNGLSTMPFFDLEHREFLDDVLNPYKNPSQNTPSTCMQERSDKNIVILNHCSIGWQQAGLLVKKIQQAWDNIPVQFISERKQQVTEQALKDAMGPLSSVFATVQLPKSLPSEKEKYPNYPVFLDRLQALSNEAAAIQKKITTNDYQYTAEEQAKIVELIGKAKNEQQKVQDKKEAISQKFMAANAPSPTPETIKGIGRWKNISEEKYQEIDAKHQATQQARSNLLEKYQDLWLTICQRLNVIGRREVEIANSDVARKAAWEARAHEFDPLFSHYDAQEVDALRKQLQSLIEELNGIKTDGSSNRDTLKANFDAKKVTTSYNQMHDKFKACCAKILEVRATIEERLRSLSKPLDNHKDTNPFAFFAPYVEARRKSYLDALNEKWNDLKTMSKECAVVISHFLQAHQHGLFPPNHIMQEDSVMTPFHPKYVAPKTKQEPEVKPVKPTCAPDTTIGIADVEPIEVESEDIKGLRKKLAAQAKRLEVVVPKWQHACALAGELEKIWLQLQAKNNQDYKLRLQVQVKFKKLREYVEKVLKEPRPQVKEKQKPAREEYILKELASLAKKTQETITETFLEHCAACRDLAGPLERKEDKLKELIKTTAVANIPKDQRENYGVRLHKSGDAIFKEVIQPRELRLSTHKQNHKDVVEQRKTVYLTLNNVGAALIVKDKDTHAELLKQLGAFDRMVSTKAEARHTQLFATTDDRKGFTDVIKDLDEAIQKGDALYNSTQSDQEWKVTLASWQSSYSNSKTQFASLTQEAEKLEALLNKSLQGSAKKKLAEKETMPFAFLTADLIKRRQELLNKINEAKSTIEQKLYDFEYYVDYAGYCVEKPSIVPFSAWHKFNRGAYTKVETV